MTTTAHEQATTDRTIFGFWVYLMTDCILFASLFATYAVLRSGVANGPIAHEIFNMPHVLIQTLLLLASSFTCGLSLLAGHRGARAQVLVWLAVTFLLGCGFLGYEITEFAGLVQEGNSWKVSAFLTSFFTLVGTHGAHITVGLFWSIFLFVELLAKGWNATAEKRFTCFGLYWHFLDIVWIFIFTIVYLMGEVG